MSRRATLTRLLATPPPGPARPGFWRSPLRGAWLTTMTGSVLLVAVTIIAVTGFASHSAYQPELPGNALIPNGQDIGFLRLGWPGGPAYLYALNQGLHVTVGIIAVPLLLAKLWSVIPRLFTWPPVGKPAEGLERLANLLLVGSAVFQFATGIANVQLYYPFHFSFVAAHYYGGVVFVASIALHVALKFPIMRRAWRTRKELTPLVEDTLRAPDPAPATLTRRGFAGMVAAASGTLFVVTAGQTIGGPFRELALLAPRGRGDHFPVNKTARFAGVTREMAGAGWRLELSGAGGGGGMSMTREELLAMDLAVHRLPIACVEGWTTTQTWEGIPLRDLAARAGVPDAELLTVTSLQAHGGFREVSFDRGTIHADSALLALRVNGADLTLDHGYPARIIAPALPGVHCTKWVGKLAFS